MLRRYCDISKCHRLCSHAHQLFFSACLLSLLCAPIAAWSQHHTGSKDTPVNTRGWLEVEEEMRNERYPKHDPAFEEGKKIYQGRGQHVKYAYCLPSNTKAPKSSSSAVAEKNGLEKSVATNDYVELNRKNLSPYRALVVGDFANLLYDCDDPGKKVLAKLEKEDAGLVIYYLNREYQLRLRQPDGPGKQAKRF